MTTDNDPVLERINDALRVETGETLKASKTAQEHRDHGRYYLTDRRGRVVATGVDLLPLARELGVMRRVVP